MTAEDQAPVDSRQPTRDGFDERMKSSLSIWLGMLVVVLLFHALQGNPWGSNPAFVAMSLVATAMGPLAFILFNAPPWLGIPLGIAIYAGLPRLMQKTQCWPIATLLWFAMGLGFFSLVARIASA